MNVVAHSQPFHWLCLLVVIVFGVVVMASLADHCSQCTRSECCCSDLQAVLHSGIDCISWEVHNGLVRWKCSTCQDPWKDTIRAFNLQRHQETATHIRSTHIKAMIGYAVVPPPTSHQCSTHSCTHVDRPSPPPDWQPLDGDVLIRDVRVSYGGGVVVGW